MRKIAGITMALLVAALFVPWTVQAHAESIGSGYRNDGASSGLSITAPNPAADISNLNPGDQKASSLLLINTGSHTLNVYMKTQIDAESALGGGSLADMMSLAVKDGTAFLTPRKSFRAAAGDGSVLVGTMSPGTRKTLDFSVNLPGEETNNRYQGSSLQVHWVFTAIYSSDGGSSGGSGSGGNNGGPGQTPGGLVDGTSSVSSANDNSSGVPNSGSTSTSVPDQPVPHSNPVTGERPITLILIIGLFAGLIASVLFAFLRKQQEK